MYMYVEFGTLLHTLVLTRNFTIQEQYIRSLLHTLIDYLLVTALIYTHILCTVQRVLSNVSWGVSTIGHQKDYSSATCVTCV